MARCLLTIALALAMSFAAVDGPHPIRSAVAWSHPEPGDEDGDGVLDEQDNCAGRRNADQRNSDGDGRPGGDAAGDACDDDADADGIPDASDNCRIQANPDQRDADGRADGDGIGDACEGDRDGDGVSDAADSCPELANPGQQDADRDGTGDVCDPDDDDDGAFDERDNCPFAFNPLQADADADGHGIECDPDDAGASDSTAPRVGVRLAAPARLVPIGAGLPVRVRCSEACAVSARLLLRRRAARRLGLGRRPVVAAGSATLAGRGATYAFLRFDRRARRVLWRQRRVRVTLRVTVRDRASNARTVDRSIALRRS